MRASTLGRSSAGKWPSRSGSEQHRVPVAFRNEDVLGTHVAVDEGELGAGGGSENAEDTVGQLGVTPSGEAQIGVET